MLKFTQKNSATIICALIALAAALRLLPHWPNFTPVAAMALFAGCMFESRTKAFLVPLAAMLLSDLIIGFHPGMFAVYLAMTLIVLLGIRVGNNVSAGRIAGASLAGSVLFFLITNLPGLSGHLYPLNASGYATSLTLALPFFPYTIAGDLFYNALLFGAYSVAVRRLPEMAK